LFPKVFPKTSDLSIPISLQSNVVDLDISNYSVRSNHCFQKTYILMKNKIEKIFLLHYAEKRLIVWKEIVEETSLKVLKTRHLFSKVNTNK